MLRFEYLPTLKVDIVAPKARITVVNASRLSHLSLSLPIESLSFRFALECFMFLGKLKNIVKLNVT